MLQSRYEERGWVCARIIYLTHVLHTIDLSAETDLYFNSIWRVMKYILWQYGNWSYFFFLFFLLWRFFWCCPFLHVSIFIYIWKYVELYIDINLTISILIFAAVQNERDRINNRPPSNENQTENSGPSMEDLLMAARHIGMLEVSEA